MRLPRLPADFTTKQPTVARVRSVLERGIPGTAMQAMAQNLTAAQLDAVVEHVRSLYGFIDAPTSRPGGAR
jgi:mono/diheme cytochrome c family protein